MSKYIRNRINQSIATDCRMFRPRRPSSTVQNSDEDLHGRNVLQSVVWLIDSAIAICICSPRSIRDSTPSQSVTQCFRYIYYMKLNSLPINCCSPPPPFTLGCSRCEDQDCPINNIIIIYETLGQAIDQCCLAVLDTYSWQPTMWCTSAQHRLAASFRLIMVFLAMGF